jgi:hypothetical protein
MQIHHFAFWRLAHVPMNTVYPVAYATIQQAERARLALPFGWFPVPVDCREPIEPDLVEFMYGL